MSIRCVLFDLDGTLIDTAPDIANALNALLQEEGRSELPYSSIRPVVSHGTSVIVQTGFSDLDTDGEEFTRLRERFLTIYRSNLFLDSDLFPGMAALLAYVEKQDDLCWGVVTNKPAFLTDPLMQGLSLYERAVCVISGDTTDQRKPHPKPMFLAAEQAQVATKDCVYVGDADRDIQAGKAAGMTTIAALYGYIDADENPDSWGADFSINEPREILDWILQQQDAA